MIHSLLWHIGISKLCYNFRLYLLYIIFHPFSALFQAPLVPLTNFPVSSVQPSGKQSDSINAIDSTLPSGIQGVRSSSANHLASDVTPNSTRTNNGNDSTPWSINQAAVSGHVPVPGATRILTSPHEGGLIISPLSSTPTTIGSLIPTHVSSSPSIVPSPSALSSGITPVMPSLTIASFSSLSSPANSLRIGEPNSLSLGQPCEGATATSIFGRQQPSSSGLSSSNNIQAGSPSPVGSINSSTSIASSTPNTNHSMNQALTHHGRSTSPVQSQVIFTFIH